MRGKLVDQKNPNCICRTNPDVAEIIPTVARCVGFCAAGVPPNMVALGRVKSPDNPEVSPDVLETGWFAIDAANPGREAPPQSTVSYAGSGASSESDSATKYLATYL